MKYNLDRLQSYDFEHLVQSICKKYIGAGCTSFGEGPDGGREASFQGKAPFPSETENWSGYWVIQAKARTIMTESQAKDHKWLKIEIEKELRKYEKRKQPVTLPDHLIFFTNIILTSVAKTGGQDKISILCRGWEMDYGIKHIHVISNHDIQNFLDLNRNLAVTYAPFILPGDVLGKMLELLDNDINRHGYIHEAMCRFLETEFREDIQTKLDQAGKLVTEKINLEKVFIDLDVISERNRLHRFKFIEQIIMLGTTVQRWRLNEEGNKFVLKAGPGQGKSTLVQFLAQAYRAYFLRELDETLYPCEDALEFIEDFNSIISVTPSWPRIPFKIILKDYAAWITETRKRDLTDSISLQNYLSRMINKKTGMEVKGFEIEILIKNMSSLFIFDGLDEVPVSSNRDVVLIELNLFTEMILRRMNADVIVIATTRPQGYSKEFDATQYNHLNIQDLSEESCKVYLSRLLKNTVDNLILRESKLAILYRALDDSQVSRIMKSPLQASIMAILVNSGGEPPTNKYDLFKQYFTTILNREKQRGISEILQSDTASVTEIHYRLGVYLQAVSEKSTNPSATIHLSQFDAILENYLQEKEFDSGRIELYIRDIQKAAIDRLVFISQVDDQKIGFAIRSLQEYFAANGYVDNISDAMVRERISKISKNSYWSNTLLFIIGHIAANKTYLTDYILSLCGELNGEELNPDEVSLSSIAKLGSWLALDILNEGIFRNNPKLENRFSKFLQPLFSLAPIDKHVEFALLSESIIDKWILDFLTQSLNEDPHNKTCWHIISVLSFHGKIDSDNIIAFAPKDFDSQLEYILQVVTEGNYEEAVLKFFDEHLTDYPDDQLYEIFSDEENHEFLCEYLKIIACGNVAKAWEYLLFATFYYNNERSSSSKLYVIMEAIIENEQEELRYFMEHSAMISSIDVVSGFSYEIRAYLPQTTGIFQNLLSFSCRNSTPLSVALCEYIENQNFGNYQKLLHEIDSQTPRYSAALKSKLSSFDSLTYTLLKTHRNDEAFFNSTKKEIFDLVWEVEPLSVQKIALFQKYSSETGYELGGKNYALDFYKLYKKEPMSSVGPLFRAYMSYFILKMDTVQLDDLKKDDSFMHFYRELCKSQEYIEPYNSSYRVLDVLYLLSVNEIIQFINVQEAVLRPELEHIFIFGTRNLDPQLIEVCLNKVIKVVQMQLITQVKVAYKYLFQTLIYFLNAFDSLTGFLIPFSDIADDEDIDQYGILLMTLDFNISDGNIKKIKGYFDINPDKMQGADFALAVRFIVRNLTIGDHLERILLLFNHIFSSNELIKSIVAEHSMAFVQSQPSLVEVDGYNIN